MKVVCSWKIIENCFKKILENLSETVTNLFDSIDDRLLVDRSNVLFRSIDRVPIELGRLLSTISLIFSTDRDTHSIDQKL